MDRNFLYVLVPRTKETGRTKTREDNESDKEGTRNGDKTPSKKYDFKRNKDKITFIPQIGLKIDGCLSFNSDVDK